MSQTTAEATEEGAMADLSKLSFSQLTEMSQAAESKLSVLRSLAFQFPDRYQGALDEASGQSVAISERLREFGGADLGLVLQDREGTAPTLSDKFGNFAENADVANLGGVGIDFSNTNPDLARQVMSGETTLEEAREGLEEPPPRTTATHPSSEQPIAPSTPE